MSKGAAVAISKRSEPFQDRSQKTYDLILKAAADLLSEVGFEKLSTNMICKRAGLTPPALYRYFPNKYAILKTLGEDLMQRQNEILESWTIAPEELLAGEAAIKQLLLATIEVTRSVRSGDWIMRSLHATPLLSNVRLESHRAIARLLTDRVLDTQPNLNREVVYDRMRIGVEMGYAIVEMVFDETAMDPDFAAQTAASMLADNLRAALD